MCCRHVIQPAQGLSADLRGAQEALAAGQLLGRLFRLGAVRFAVGVARNSNGGRSAAHQGGLADGQLQGFAGLVQVVLKRGVR